MKKKIILHSTAIICGFFMAVAIFHFMEYEWNMLFFLAHLVYSILSMYFSGWVSEKAVKRMNARKNLQNSK